jgi:hypothetical protein
MLICVTTTKEKGMQFPFTVELIMNFQFDWMEVLYAQNTRLRKSNLSFTPSKKT